MSYFDLPERTRRQVAAGAAAVCGTLALVGTIDRTPAVSVLEQRLLLIAGVAGGTVLGWVVEHVTHRPVSRRALLPWGSLGGAIIVLVAAAQATPILSNLFFIGVTVVRALLAAACVRFIVEASSGPLLDVPSWAASHAEFPVEDEAQAWRPIQPPSPPTTEGPAAWQPPPVSPPLRLIDNKEDDPRSNETIEQPKPGRRTRP